MTDCDHAYSRDPRKHRGALQVALAMPGGFEFGGIGRIMLYTCHAWGRLPGAPIPKIIDARGSGPLWLSPVHMVRSVAWLAVARVRGGVDLLHLNVAGRGSSIRKLVLSETAAALGISSIVHLHDYDYEADLAKRLPVTRALLRRMFQRATAVVVLGRRDAQTVSRALGVDPARVARLPNSVPDPGPPPDRAPGRTPARILFLGHLDERKGVPELLRCLATPELRRRSWHLDLAGGGQVERFAAMAEQIGIRSRLTFHGWRSHDDVAELARSSDVFVLPSHGEGQAMALLEAMAHGLAIVTTPVGAHLETVRQDVEALLVPPGDEAALGNALARLIDEPTLRLRLGTRARLRFLQDFKIDRYAADLATIYDAVLSNGTKSRDLAEVVTS